MNEIDAIRIDLPAEWLRLPVDADEADAFLRERQATSAWSRLSSIDRRVLENFVRRLTNEMRIQRCELAAVFVQPVVDNEVDSVEESAPVLICASLLVALVSREQTGSVLRLDADVLLAAMTSTGEGDPKYRELERPEIVEIPAGRVVRTRRLHQLDENDNEVFVELYLVPMAPDFEFVCMVQFATPTLDLVNEFSAVFDAMVATFAMYREGEPTPA